MVGQGPTDGQQVGLDAWRAAGTDEVMLPTGTLVRIFRPSLERLAREELLVGTLRAAALREQVADGSDEQARAAREKAHALVGEHLLEFCPPGGEWLPTPAEIAAGDLSLLPPVDREALVSLALHAHSPRLIDTRSRLALGIITEKEAGTILSRESGGIASWAGFRPEPAGEPDGAYGAGLRDEPQRPTRRARSRRGVSAGRGAGPAPGAQA